MRDEAEADLPGSSLELVIPQPRQVVEAPEYMFETDYYYSFRMELRSLISDHYKIRRSTPSSLSRLEAPYRDASSTERTLFSSTQASNRFSTCR